MAHLLALRALGLGDFLTAVPAYRALRRAFPDHRLTLAAPAGLAELARLTGAVDDVHDTTDLDAFSWAGPPPDVAVNLHGRGPQSHDRLLGTRPGRLVAYSRPGLPGPRWRDEEHEVHRWCRLLDAAGIPADRADLRLGVPTLPSPAPEAVVIHPGAAYGSKRWPSGRFAGVARTLAGQGHRVVVTGSGPERGLARQVVEAAGLPPEALLAGRTPLVELAALVAGARLVVCGDTGMSHLATAYGTPSVVLFGPVSPARWGPPPLPRHVALWHGGGTDPFAAEPAPALLAITPDEVLAAVHRVLPALLTDSR